MRVIKGPNNNEKNDEEANHCQGPTARGTLRGGEEGGGVVRFGFGEGGYQTLG